jgi:hypothetical protein
VTTTGCRRVSALTATGSPVGRWALPRIRSKPYFYVVDSAHPTVIENGAESLKNRSRRRERTREEGEIILIQTDLILPKILEKPHPALSGIPLLIKERERF